MSRNQLTKALTKAISGNPIFTVDGAGNVQPTTTQTVGPGGTILISVAPAATSVYGGYVCAWQGGQCKCSTLVTDLLGEPHMEINPSAYTISASASGSYTLYATLSETGEGPTGNATNGDIHIGS